MRKKIISIACIVIGAAFILTGCASWRREVKSFSSNLGGGIDRTVTVYANTGEKIAEYSGKIDIESNENKVLFDLDGKRTIIYNAIVIAQED